MTRARTGAFASAVAGVEAELTADIEVGLLLGRPADGQGIVASFPTGRA